MKKIIRLTESDLVRIVKRVIKEDEENLKKLHELIAAGVDNYKAFLLAQVDDEYTWYDLFQMYGQTIVDELFDNDPSKFYYFANDSSPDVMIQKYYPRFNGEESHINNKNFFYSKLEAYEVILLDYFFGGNQNRLVKFLTEKWSENQTI